MPKRDRLSTAPHKYGHGAHKSLYSDDRARIIAACERFGIQYEGVRSNPLIGAAIRLIETSIPRDGSKLNWIKFVQKNFERSLHKYLLVVIMVKLSPIGRPGDLGGVADIEKYLS